MSVSVGGISNNGLYLDAAILTHIMLSFGHYPAAYQSEIKDLTPGKSSTSTSLLETSLV